FLTEIPSNTKFCYRHRPDAKCRKVADETKMAMIQRVSLAPIPRLFCSIYLYVVQIWAVDPHVNQLRCPYRSSIPFPPAIERLFRISGLSSPRRPPSIATSCFKESSHNV